MRVVDSSPGWIREEIIAGILDSAQKFGLPVDRNSAEKITDQGHQKYMGLAHLKWVFWAASPP